MLMTTYLVVREAQLLQLGQPVQPSLVHSHHLVMESSVTNKTLSSCFCYLIPIKIQLLNGIKTIEGAIHQEPERYRW